MRIRIAVLTTDDRLGADLQRFCCAIRMADRRAEDHTTAGRLLLAATLKNPRLLRESVLHVHVSLLQDTHAVAGDHHVLRGFHVHLDHDGPVDLAFNARRRVLPAHATSLVEHVWRNTAQVRADENLKSGRLVVTDQSHDGKPVPSTVFHSSSGAFCLVSCSMLLLWLANNLQLDLSVYGSAA